MINKKYDYLIVGCGLFGATFAEQAISKGKKVLILEKRDHIGGNIYTKNIEDINVHIYGAHIFHTSNEVVWNYINKFARFNNFINSPLGFYKGKYYHLPFNMNTFKEIWNVDNPIEAKKIIEFQIAKENIKEPNNLEEQALSLVGRDIYEILIKGYTEKQWGQKATELPPFIIKRLPLRFEFNNNYFNDKYQGIPLGGYTKMIEKMIEGCDIILNQDYLSNKEYYNSLADKVLYTGPLDEYYDYKYGELDYRSLEFDIIILDQEYYQNNCVINFEEYDIPYTRIIEHKYFENTISKKTVITKEYPKTYQRGLERYYPINNDKNNKLYEKYLNLTHEENNVIFGGRLASYKYYDMDDTIEAALELSSKI